MKRTLALAVLVVVAVGIAGNRDLLSRPGVIGMRALMLVAVLFALTIVWFVVFALSVAIGAARLSAEQRDVTYEFNDEGQVVRDGTGASIAMPWKVVRRAREFAKGFYIELKPRGVRYVPSRAFDPAGLPALRALLREKLGDGAKLRGG